MSLDDDTYEKLAAAMNVTAATLMGEADYTHQHHPDYLVRPPHRNGTTQSITSFIEKADFPRATEGPVYFYLGLRCYSQERWNNEPAPPEYFRPACRRIMKEFERTHG